MSKNVIPEFSDDPKTLETALRVVKELLEDLAGQRPGNSLGAPSIYIQPTAPTSQGNQLARKDIWIQEGSGKIHYFDGRLWRDVTV